MQKVANEVVSVDKLNMLVKTLEHIIKNDKDALSVYKNTNNKDMCNYLNGKIEAYESSLKWLREDIAEYKFIEA